jgi:hypothetical protein
MSKIDLNKIPPFTRNILENFLIPLFPNNTHTCLLNCLNSKLAQVVAFKKAKFQKTEQDLSIPINYYALNFVASGGGKNVIFTYLDDYLLCLLQKRYEDEDQKYYKSKLSKIEAVAEKRFPKNENSRNNFIQKEEKNIGQIRFVSDIAGGTPEGLFSQLLIFQEADLGCPFYQNNEFGGFMENCNPQEKALLYKLLDVYDGKAYDKSIKTEKRTKNINGVPVNIMFMSDTDKLLEPKAYHELMKYFGQGMIRRAFITYQPRSPVKIFRDVNVLTIREDTAKLYAKNQQQRITDLINDIPLGASYKLQRNARNIYVNYIADCAEKHNEIFGKIDNICLSDILNRFWKTLKLAALIAVTEHPQQLIITVQDMNYAIYQTELFAEDFSAFFKATPTSDAEKLFYYFYDNKNKWLTRTDINKQKFVHKDRFKMWFDENLEYLHEIANKKGFAIVEESMGSIGKKYILIDNNIGQELSSGIKNLNDII